MVRNPRTLMMCSLLALATGLALGSQIAPAVVGTPATRMPAFAERLHAWGVRQPDTAYAPPPTALPPIRDTDPTIDSTLDGGRQPRLPRASRDAQARAPR
jgi:hypothetical protein